MSAPATNALSPEPVIITPLTSLFRKSAVSARFNSSMVRLFKALSCFGLLMIIMAAPPEILLKYFPFYLYYSLQN